MLFYLFVFSLIEVFDLKDCHNKSELNLGMIAAMGDSVLSGYGARQFFVPPFFNPMNFREDRGASAITGGDEDMWSMYKMAQVFNPDIQGKSTGTHFINLCRGVLCFWPFNLFRKNDGLNMAETGSFTGDLQRQATELVKRINVIQKSNPSMQKKWKLINILTGLNDQCNTCVDHKRTLLYYDFYLRNIFDYFRQNLEFVIINVLSVWNLNEMIQISSRHPACMHTNKQSLFKSMCKCPFGKNGTAYRSTMKDLQFGQNTILKSIVQSFQNGTAWSKKEKQTHEWVAKPSNFKLIYDPSAELMDLNQLHFSAITQTDCSHPTKEMHERMASVYWRNLFLSSRDKLKNQSWAFEKGYIRFTCPTTIKFD